MDAQKAQERIGGSVARRGVLAGVATLVAGVLAKASERVAQAGVDHQPLVIGEINTSTIETVFQRNNPNTPGTHLSMFNNAGLTLEATSLTADAIKAVSSQGQGSAVYAQSGSQGPVVAAAGVCATSSNRYGVLASSAFETGVLAVSHATGPGLGPICAAVGTSDTQIGVYGTSASNYGVRGLSTSSTGVLGSSNSGAGVQGSSNGNVGVLGQSNASVGVYASSTNQYGLYATSSSSFAAIGTSNTGTGVYGSSNGNVGVQGSSNSSIGGFFSSGTGTGLYATGPASGFAARFDGPVLVNGNFTAVGGSKSAAVPHPDGSHRRLYCVESPESWFEDFGREQLVNGRARVRLDSDFDALVRGDNYQVFLTPEGDCKGLYVSAYNPHAFEVRELQGGTSNLAFSYRVVAKRKDIPGPRLERVDIPGAPQRPAAPPPPPVIPTVPPLPDPNAPPRIMPVPETGRDR